MTRSAFEAIREALPEIPVIDAHEHLSGHSECRPSSSVTDFMAGGYMNTLFYLNTLLVSSEPERARLVTDETRPDRERWASFLDLWPLLRATGYGCVIPAILRWWGLDEEPTVESYDAILEKIGKRSPEYARAAFAGANIRASISHYLAHPCCGGIENVGRFLRGELVFEEGFYQLLGTLPLHQFYNFEECRMVGAIAGRDIGSVEDLARAAEEIVSSAAAKGVVGLKDHAAYTRGLSFGEPNESAAGGGSSGVL